MITQTIISLENLNDHTSNKVKILGGPHDQQINVILPEHVDYTSNTVKLTSRTWMTARATKSFLVFQKLGNPMSNKTNLSFQNLGDLANNYSQFNFPEPR